MRTRELFAFIKERHAIYTRRAAGQPKPWTADPILQKYRFCNIYRELDAVTVWVRENWRTPNAEDPELWFAMLVARMYNLPSTLSAIGYPVPYRAEQIRKTVNRLQAAGRTVFNGAYMVRCDCQRAGRTKTDYLIEKVFTPAWKERALLRPCAEDSLSTFHARLVNCYGLGSFMAAQVVADVKFTAPLSKALDWWTWAAPGPGSARGLNAVVERDFNASWRKEEWATQLKVLQTKIDPLVHEANMPRISAQDLQNSLCEYSGYYKVRYLGLRKKQLYPGT